MARRKTLAGKIFAGLFSASFIVMLAAAVAATAASFSAYENEAERSLLDQADAWAGSISAQDEQGMVEMLGAFSLLDTRCTLVAADGSVLYDNYTDIANMKNHGDREEVASARSSGRVVLTRKSETLGSYTLYAATQVRDGIVLRLADTRTSLASFLANLALPLVISLIVIFVVSLVASRLLTKVIVRPLCDIDLSRPLENDAYEELQPLLKRVDEQRSELESQNRQLEEAVVFRREFTGNVSHEMKTPLQVIGGYAELMEGGMVAACDIPKFAGVIRSESESMRTLIDDVLTLSRLDERAASKTEIPIMPAQVCKRVAARLESAAAEYGASVELDLDESALIIGDEPLFEHMVYNLIDNAIKYGDCPGKVFVTVTRGEGLVTLTVADDGPGIPEELRERVFERFFRADTSRSREKGGTGLGLAIVKHVAEEHGGSVSVGSAAAGGAEFKVVIPEAKLDVLQQARTAEPVLGGSG